MIPLRRIVRVLNFGGLFSCSIGGVLALISYLKGKEARYLGSATYLENLYELKQVIALAPIVVAVAGRVWAPKPLKCELSNNEGVIVELREDRKYEQRLSTPGVWLTESEPLRETHRHTDWALVESLPGRGKVEIPVQNARRLYGDYLQMSGDVFIPAESNLVDQVISQLAGSKSLGIRRSEGYLPLGTAITAIGELAPVVDTIPGNFKHAIRSNGKLYALRAPSSSSLILSRQTFPELLSNAQSSSQTCKEYAIFFSMMGIGMALTAVGLEIRQKYLERKAIRRLIEERQRRRRNSEETSSPTAIEDILNNSSRQDEASPEGTDPDQGTCVVCFQRTSTMCWPCGHLCCCTQCASQGGLDRCPICRSRGRPIRVYVT